MYNFVYRILLLAVVLCLTGCIAKVAWVEREGGTPVKKRWLPVCHSCNQVVNYDSAQCPNPECRILLAWEDKIIYPEKEYGESEENPAPIKPAVQQTKPTPAPDKPETKQSPATDNPDSTSPPKATAPAKQEQSKDTKKPDKIGAPEEEDLDNEKNW
jgi:RNA polymerase subunit RPABC4/transcription elongation factor Spt4